MNTQADVENQGSESRERAACYLDTWMTESLCCSTETITKLLISYTPIHNKKFERKKINIWKGEGNKEHNLVMSKILIYKNISSVQKESTIRLKNDNQLGKIYL